jgi:adenine-specific DNA-methyltransferase
MNQIAIDVNTCIHHDDSSHDVITNHDEDAINHILISGDNLQVMKAMKPSISHRINAIYIDPPYNTGSTSFVYNDHYDDHKSWTDFMRPRLMEAYDVLCDDGIIFISIDDHEQPYLRILMNEIFGERNFIGEFIRKTKTTTNDVSSGFNQQHEYLVIYAKTPSARLRGALKPDDAYHNPDNDPKGKWKRSDMSANKGDIRLNYFPIINPYTGQTDYPPQGSYWRLSINTIQQHIDNGDIVFRRTIEPGKRGFIYKRYYNQLKNPYQSMNSLDGDDNAFMNQQGRKDLKAVVNASFQYPKSVDYLTYILSFMPKDSIIMDFFAGSGTTGQTVAQMNSQDDGHRQCIMITAPENDNIPETITAVRMKRVLTGTSWNDGLEHPCLHQNLRYYTC